MSKPSNYISGNNPVLTPNSGMPLNVNKPPTLTHNLGYNVPTFNTNLAAYPLPNSQLPTFNNINYSVLPPTTNFVATFKPNPHTPIHNATNVQPYFSNFGTNVQANTSKTVPNYNPSINTNFQPLMRPTEYNTYESTLNRGNLFSIPNYSKTETNQVNPLKDNHSSSRY